MKMVKKDKFFEKMVSKVVQVGIAIVQNAIKK